jgi:carbonic anhydrase/acetyltransferase-like protein (isoleucine patch superfamily)
MLAGEHRDMLRAFRGTEPEVAESAYVDPAATVIGDVTVGPEATVLPGAVIRGDGGSVELRERANVQDNATIHADGMAADVVLKSRAAVGHNAIVHNATLGERSLVGMHATVLDEAVLEPRSIVAATALVREGEQVETGTLVGGVPAAVLRDDLDPAHPMFHVADRYAEHVDGLEPVDGGE